MPQSLAPIPLSFPIVGEDGAINDFYRLRWQQLMDGFTLTPTKAQSSVTGQTAGLATTTVLLAPVTGRYRISVYLRKTVADGVSSSLTLTLGWTDGGTPETQAFSALTTDTGAAFQSSSIVVNADAASNITWAVAYASNTPNKCTWNGYIATELLA